MAVTESRGLFSPNNPEYSIHRTLGKDAHGIWSEQSRWRPPHSIEVLSIYLCCTVVDAILRFFMDTLGRFWEREVEAAGRENAGNSLGKT